MQGSLTGSRRAFLQSHDHHRRFWRDPEGQGRCPLISEGIDREPSLRFVRLINEVLPVFSGSGSLPLHAAEIQISKLSSSFRIVLICQIEELVLDDFELPVSHWRSGNPI